MPISGLFEVRMGGFFAAPVGGLFHANTQLDGVAAEFGKNRTLRTEI